MTLVGINSEGVCSKPIESNWITDFLGWDASVTSGLQIRHNTPSQPIIFATAGVERMRIKPNRTIAVNTTDNENARFNIHQDVTGETAVGYHIDNQNGNSWNSLNGIRTISGCDFSIKDAGRNPAPALKF